MDSRLRLEIEENEAGRGLANVLHFLDFQVHGASPREKFFAQIFSKKAATRTVQRDSVAKTNLKII